MLINKSAEPPVILIGLTPQGLSLLRMLSRTGFSVIAFAESKKEVGFSSKYGKKQIFSSISDLKTKLLAIRSQYKDSSVPLKCLIASGVDLAAILRFFPDIYDLFDIEPSPYTTVNDLSHKNIAYKRCRNLDIPYAQYRLLNGYKEGDLRYPLILKKNYEIKTFFKTKIAYSQEEFDEFVSLIPKEQFEDIIVQEFIQAEIKREISCQFYLRRGCILAFLPSIQPRRLKKGLTSYIEEIIDETLCARLRGVSSQFLAYLNYTGFIEIEYLYDEAKDALYFIETNTRPCGLNSSMVHKFPDLASVYKSPEILTSLQPAKGTLKWVNIQRDLRARWEHRDFSKLYQIIVSKHDIFDWKDLKPFFRQFFKWL